MTEQKRVIQIQSYEQPRRSIYGPTLTKYRLFFNGVFGAYLEVANYFDFCAIHAVTVMEPYRRQGLMKYLLRHVRQKHGRQLRLLVLEDNAPAIALYQSLGFRFVENLKNRRLLQTLKNPDTRNPLYDEPLTEDLPEMVWAKPRKQNSKDV